VILSNDREVKKLKKLIRVMTTVTVMLLITVLAVSASGTENELEGIAETIIEEVNALFSEELGQEITKKDVNLENAYKIYVGTNVFDIEKNSAKELKELLETGGYIYELPIYIDGSTVIVNIAKGQALNVDVEFTKEEKEKINRDADKWNVTAVKYYQDEKVDYHNVLEKNRVKDTDEILLVGGLPHFRYAVALIPDENGQVDGLLPLSDVPGIEVIRSYKVVSESNVYNYESTKEYINQLPEEDSELSTGYGFTSPKVNYYPIFIGICIILMAILIFFGVHIYQMNRSE